MIFSRSTRRIVGFCSVAIAVIACVLFVDRPLALWLNRTFSGTPAFDVGALIPHPLDPVLAAAALLLVVAGLWKALGHPPSWVTRFLTGVAAAALALLVTVALKFVLGRSQVYPSFLRDHVYTFRLFSWSKDYGAFPSATMSGASAFLIGLGAARGRRWLVTTVLVVLAGALLVTNGHWLGDIIAGTYLGFMLGTFMSAIVNPS